MFRLDEGASALQKSVDMAERNYVIQEDDLLTIDVFTNDGERIIDPDFELMRDVPLNNQNLLTFNYLVQIDGQTKLPMIGKVDLKGMTIDEAETKLEELYNHFYKDVFVKLAFENKRVIVLGAPGGQVIPLVNQNMTLVEILALSGGVEFGAKVHNVRIVRGPLSSPTVFEIDLNTVDGMRQSVIPIEPGDIIYVEPWRRPFFEVLRDLSPVFQASTSVVALVVLIRTL
ncbi:MAG: polysaccharide biosynthesis/export family protein [Cytophagales bacterium]|nr:polysaccharide biosynthesis/export family protein [Cytophagales bacterium]